MKMKTADIRPGDILAYERGLQDGNHHLGNVTCFVQVASVDVRRDRVYAVDENGKEGWLRTSLFTQHLTKREERYYEIDKDRILIRNLLPCVFV